MSRIGKNPIVIPAKVEVKVEDGLVVVKGPKGTLTQKLHEAVKVEIVDNNIIVTVTDPENHRLRALWGLFRSLINNMVVGVTNGFEKKLEINGIGFKAAVSGKKLVLNVGFSHPVEFSIPEGVNCEVVKNIINISGNEKQLVGEVAASIRRIKKPEPYQGKGIKYADEVLRRKAGKTASKASA